MGKSVIKASEDTGWVLVGDSGSGAYLRVKNGVANFIIYGNVTTASSSWTGFQNVKIPVEYRPDRVIYSMGIEKVEFYIPPKSEPETATCQLRTPAGGAFSTGICLTWIV